LRSRLYCPRGLSLFFLSMFLTSLSHLLLLLAFFFSLQETSITREKRMHCFSITAPSSWNLLKKKSFQKRKYYFASNSSNVRSFFSSSCSVPSPLLCCVSLSFSILLLFPLSLLSSLFLSGF
jgi:hypothetical protein